MSTFAHWLTQINQWEPSGGWPTTPLPQALAYRAPRTPCPHCAVEGDTSVGEVAAVSVVGGEVGIIWHIVCDRGHVHSYPASLESEDEA